MRMDISVHLRNASNRVPSTRPDSEGPAKHRPRLIIDLSLITNESGGSRKEKKEKRGVRGEGGGGGGGGGGGRMLTSCPTCHTSFRCGGGGGAGAGPGAVAQQQQQQAEEAGVGPEAEYERLRLTMERLRASGWYHEGLTWRQANGLLTPCALGTFLVRNSADPNSLFTLSVQTENGPTSVRLHYADGYFRMAAEPELVRAMPRFDCVVKLVEYYVSVSRGGPAKGRCSSGAGSGPVWVDCMTGAVHADLRLRRPLYTPDGFPSLQHLARLAVNALPASGPRPRPTPPSTTTTTTLPLTLHHYLTQYPYTH